MNRETIYSALFNLLSNAAVFQTTSRRLQHWSDVPAISQPALFMAQKRELAQTVPPLPTVWTLVVDVYVYVNTGNNVNDTVPASLINPLIDALTATLAPDPITNKQTLGGLVQHAWIEGEIITDEGWLGDQAIAVIPIYIKYV